MESKTPSTKKMMAAIPSQSSLVPPHEHTDNGTPTQVTTNNQANHAKHKPSGTNGLKTSSTNGSKPAVVPVSGSPRDIICGRGLHIMNHHGNHNLHLIVDKHRQVYLTATRKEKAAITRNIVQELKSTGVRFLRRFNDNSDGKWVEVDDKTAYKKVGHALRLRKSDHGQNFLKSLPVQQVDSELSATFHSTPRREIRTSQDVAAMSSLPNNPMVHPSRLSAPASFDMQIPLSSIVNQLQVLARQSALHPNVGTHPQPMERLPAAVNGYGNVIHPQNTMIPPPGLSVSASLAPQLPLPPVPTQLQAILPQAAIPQYIAVQPQPTVTLPAVSGYGNVAIDPVLYAQVFASTLAMMTQMQHQQPVSSFHASSVDSSSSKRSPDEERRGND